jgi:hypothetical protein
MKNAFVHSGQILRLIETPVIEKKLTGLLNDFPDDAYKKRIAEHCANTIHRKNKKR